MDDQDIAETDNAQPPVELTLDRLTGGDRAAAFFLGMLAAKVLKKDGMVVLTVDALGRVCLLPPSSVEVTHPYRVPDEDLDKLPEDAAIQVMVAQKDSEAQILEYLAKRPK